MACGLIPVLEKTSGDDEENDISISKTLAPAEAASVVGTQTPGSPTVIDDRKNGLH